MDAYLDFSSEAELRKAEIRFQGTGAANPTKEYGQAATIVRTGTGVYTVTYPEYPGKYAGSSSSNFDATVASGVAGYTCVVTQTSPLIYTVSVFNGANAAADLAAGQWVNLTLKFKAGSNT